jgi:hypothetical protein
MEARYIHGQREKECLHSTVVTIRRFQHQVGDPPTVLTLHSNSPVRLI